MASYSHRTQYQ